MKNLLFTLAFATLMAGSAMAQLAPASSSAAPQETAVNGAVMTLEETEFDFGDITQGDVVEHVFKFKNSGTQPLIIEAVTATCGCTTPAWTKEPIMPGKTGFVTAKFNSAGRTGKQKKAITIRSNNTEGTKYVYIVTNIKEKGAASAGSAKVE